MIGHVQVRFTKGIVDRVKDKYDELTGASAFEQETRTLMADVTEYLQRHYVDLGVDLQIDALTKREYLGGTRDSMAAGSPKPIWLALSDHGTVEITQEQPEEKAGRDPGPASGRDSECKLPDATHVAADSDVSADADEPQQATIKHEEWATDTALARWNAMT